MKESRYLHIEKCNLLDYCYKGSSKKNFYQLE